MSDERDQISERSFFHDGMRELQDRFGGRRVADRLVQHRSKATFDEWDREVIEGLPFFFIASAWGGSVDCSIKSGHPGFVRVTGPAELTWPDYDGNRMYRTLGNILKSPRVGLLFVRFDGQRRLIRVSGAAHLVDERPDPERWPGARRLVRVVADRVYYNCARGVPHMSVVAVSEYLPRAGYNPPEPPWKSGEHVRDVIDD